MKRIGRDKTVKMKNQQAKYFSIFKYKLIPGPKISIWPLLIFLLLECHPGPELQIGIGPGFPSLSGIEAPLLLISFIILIYEIFFLESGSICSSYTFHTSRFSSSITSRFLSIFSIIISVPRICFYLEPISISSINWSWPPWSPGATAFVVAPALASFLILNPEPPLIF